MLHHVFGNRFDAAEKLPTDYFNRTMDHAKRLFDVYIPFLNSVGVIPHDNSLVEYSTHVGAVAHLYVERYVDDLEIQTEIGALPETFEHDISATLGFALFADKNKAALRDALVCYGYIDG